MPDISIIIVNYNSYELTSACIRSVQTYTTGVPYEIVLVDNASTECDPQRFKDVFPDIVLVRSQLNGGFATGNNVGIAVAKGEYILLLNSDTLLTEDSVSRSLNAIKSDPETGVLGCRMTYPDGTIQYSARSFRSIGREILDLFRFMPMMMSYENRSVLMQGRYFKHDKDMYSEWVNGAFFLFPKKILTQLPGQKLDERFFMYGEDQLWCYQIHKLGYKVKFFAGTTIIHIHSGSTRPEKQLGLRKLMLEHELEIMRERKGKGPYYFCFKLLYGGIETARNAVKWVVLKLTGKLIR